MMERDGITQSGLGLFNLCPKKAELRLMQGLERNGASHDRPLEFGSYFHDVLDKTYSQRVGELSKTVLSGQEIKYWSLLANKALDAKAAKSKDLDPAEEQAMEVTAGLSAVVIKRYFKRWAVRDTKRQIIAVEKVLSFPYKLRNGVTILIWCKIDLIERINGKLWITDHKTKSQIEDFYLAEKMAFDLQMMIYSLCVLHNYGEWPEGFNYNLIKRPGQKFTGTYYKKPESLAQYLERVDKHMEEKGDEYFCRNQISVSQAEIQTYRDRDLDYQIERMYEWSLGGYVSYRNSGACMKWNKPCEFLPICGGSHDAHKLYTKRLHVFPELVNDEGGDD